MIIVACDICRKNLTNVQIQQGKTLVYCERCQAWSENYEQELSKLIADINQDNLRRMDKFRNDFIRRHVDEKPQLRAV